MQQNYLTMDRHDLEKVGFGGARLNLCLFLSSKCYDVSQVILIIIYCILLAITFLVEDFLYAPDSRSPAAEMIQTCENSSILISGD